VLLVVCFSLLAVCFSLWLFCALLTALRPGGVGLAVFLA
jgi:hypothetical protein